MTEMETPAKLAPLSVSYGDIVRAAAAIRGSVIKTRFEPSRTLTELLGAEIWLKFENQQFTASYKERGALNKLLSLLMPRRPTASSRCRPAITHRASPITRIGSPFRQRS